MPSAEDVSAIPKEQNHHVSKLGSRIAAHFAKVGLTTELPELHGQMPQAVRVRPDQRRTPIHPGEHLAEELKELSISAAELARQIVAAIQRSVGCRTSCCTSVST
jgi:hypothetical protein